MAEPYDFFFTLAPEGTVQAIQCSPAGLLLPMAEQRNTWIGLAPENIPGTHWELESGILLWDQIQFTVSRLEPVSGLHCLLLQRQSDREKLLEGTLDMIPDGIQVYDTHGNIQFFNRSTLNLLEYPSSQEAEGRHILEVFAVNPEYSTTLSVLKTHSSVFGRFDHYKSTTGKELSTVNTGIPII